MIKFPWPYRGSYFVKRNKNTVIRFTVVWSFLWCFCHYLFLIGKFVMVDSPRFPKSSGIDPTKALILIPPKPLIFRSIVVYSSSTRVQNAQLSFYRPKDDKEDLGPHAYTTRNSSHSFHERVHGDLSVSIRLAFPYECGSA